jgi:hypothetical protein
MLASRSYRAWVCWPCLESGKRDPARTRGCMVPLFELSENHFQIGLRRPPARGDYITVEVLLAPRHFSRGWLGRVVSMRPGADGLWYTECEIIGPR